MFSNRLLGAMLILQCLTLAGQWLGAPAVLPAAQAQIPDAGAQRIQILDELKSLNAKMDKLVGLMSGPIQVRVTNPEELQKAAPAR